MVNNFEQFDSQIETMFQKNKLIKNSSFRIYILLFSFIFAFLIIGIQMILMAVNPTAIHNEKKVVVKDFFKRKEMTILYLNYFYMLKKYIDYNLPN